MAAVKAWAQRMWIAAAVVAVGLACSPPPAQHRVEIGAIATRDGPLPFDASVMRPKLDRELARTRYLRGASAANNSERLLADLWLADASGDPLSKSTQEFVLSVELDAPPGLRSVLKDTRITAQVLVERNEGAVDLERDLVLAARRAFEVLDTQIALARGDRKALEDSLQANDPEQVCLALEWIRDHRPDVSADRIAALLEHEDLRVVRLAVEALRQSGSHRHVPAIVRAVDLRDPDYTREVYRTLAALGGPEAVQFLGFAAANEDDPTLRREAKQAFEVVLARAPATGGDFFRQTDDTAGDRTGGATGPIQPLRGHR